MSTSGPGNTVQQLIDRARELQDAIHSASTKESALEAALSAVEVSMQALKLSKDPASKKQIGAQVKDLLSEAERIKTTGTWSFTSSQQVVEADNNRQQRIRTLKAPSSTRELSTAEKIILLKASYLNGSKFPPWQSAPHDPEFDLADDQNPFTDAEDLRLSSRQLECFEAWRRPADALPPPMMVKDLGQKPAPSAPSMLVTTKHNLVQDAATDCSVVASLCDGSARVSKGHPSILRDLLYPYDREADQPKLSASGKYILKYNFNGTYRRVEIDDRLPVSKTDRIIHVVDKNDPTVLWPALIEKAYLKVRGGYDFLGSNSGTDIWVTTGWIPEQIFLSGDDVPVFDVWEKIHNGFNYGDVLVTAGTAKMSETLENETGLVGEHDYAILDIREVDGQRFMLIKNPWCEGPTWRSRTAATSFELRSNIDDESQGDGADVRSPRDLLNADSQLSPGTFWMDLNNVSQHFDAIYLNWNPGLFQYRQDIHFSWDLTQVPNRNSLTDNPQFVFSVCKGEVAWLLLCRHFQSTVPTATVKEDGLRSPGYINIFVYDARGVRVFLNDSAVARGNFVDSPQVLLRLDGLKADHPYTIVAMQDSLAATVQTFTLCAWANSAMTLERAPEKLSHQLTVSASWTEETAGGNTHSPLYGDNPQFSLTVPSNTALIILLETLDQNLPVHVKLVHGQGKRVQNVRSRDIVFDSKEHRRGCALAQIRDIDPGRYTIVCSTFEAGQKGDFTLRVDSSVPLKISPLPRIGAGRIKSNLSPAVFRTDQQRLGAPLQPNRLTKLSFLIRQRISPPTVPSTTPPIQQRTQERSMIRITIESWSGRMEQDKVLTTSGGGEFRDSASGVLTQEVDVYAAMTRHAGLWVTVERMVSAKDLDQEKFSVDMFTETPGAVTVGEWRCLDD